MVNYRFLTTSLPQITKKTHNLGSAKILGSCAQMDTNQHVVKPQFCNIRTIIAVFALFLLYIVPAFSQVVFNGKVQANTGWLRLSDPTSDTDYDLWTSSGYVQLNLETTGSQTIKGYVSGSYSVDSPDLTKSTMAVAQSGELDRAYVKIRLPWLDGRKMRLNIGKMPVSWGYGMVYNAGDIIFGALPSDSSGATGGFATSESSLSELRAAADWFVNASLPIVSGLTLEPLLRLPLSLDEAQNANDVPSFGGRVLWTPYWQAMESAEAGYLASRDGKTHYAYAGLDGNLYVDYNLAAQARVDIDKENSTDTQWVVSGALSKAFTFVNYDTGYEMPLSFRLESLWIPTQNNHSVLFAFASAQVTDTLGLALNWVGTVNDGTSPSVAVSTAHLLSASATLTPIQGLEFTLSSFIDAEKPKDMSGVSVGATYRF